MSAIVLLLLAPMLQMTMKPLLLDMIHPAANDILLFVNRGESSAAMLAESGNLSTTPGRARD